MALTAAITGHVPAALPCVITAVAALLGNLLAARQHRANTERLLHAADEKLRAGRQRLVGYLSAYSDLREKINASAA